MDIEKLSSAALNSIISGLSGYEATLNIPLEQLADEISETRLAIIFKYFKNNMLPEHDLYYSINCIELDCSDFDRCCEHDALDELVAHFEIPQIATFLRDKAIEWIGSTDRKIKFKVYTSHNFRFHKYKTRGAKKPFVYIDCTPNKNNRYDAFVFNAPMLERISISAVFKEMRDLKDFSCCEFSEVDNLTNLAIEVKDTVVNKYIQYYRKLYAPPMPNTQNPGPV